jgi:hypothetical protein
VLHSLELLIADSSERNAVTKIADAFSLGGSTTVAAVLKRTTSANAASISAQTVATSNSVTQLRRTLSHATKFLSAAGAKTAAADLQGLIDALPATSESSPANWIEALSNALTAPSKKGKPKKGPPPSPADQVQAYVKRFNDAGMDESAFRAVYAALSTDTAVKMPEAKEIVAQVTQLTAKHASKKKALDFLLEDFYSRKRRQNELASVSKARPW